MVETLNVELRGDRAVAKWLQGNHLNRVLYEFKDNNKQHLPILSARKNFFTPDGGFIGEIYTQVVHGAYTVVITGAAPKPVVKEEIKLPLQTVQIVPCMRSEDSKYLVACLSGTFDGPYMLFKTSPNVDVANFDDNSEGALNGKPVASNGQYELIFVSQTGSRPDDIGPVETGSTSSGPNPETSFYAYSCYYNTIECEIGDMDEYLGYVMETETSASSDTYTEEYTLFGGVGSVLPIAYTSESSGSGTRSRIFGSENSFEWSEVFCGESNREFIEWYINYPPEVRAKELVLGLYSTLAGNSTDIKYGDYATNSSGVNSIISASMFDGYYSVRAESPSNLCAGYRVGTEVQSSVTSQSGPDPCSGAIGDLVTTSELSTTYSDYFQVDSVTFLINGPQSSRYPVCIQAYGGKLKYYNTGSAARLTGLMSVAVDVSGNVYDEFRYFYVGPNSDNALITTVFPAENGEWEHTVPGVELDGELLKFSGSVCMGLIRTFTEQTLPL